MIQNIHTLLGYDLPLSSTHDLTEILRISNTKHFDAYKLEKDFYLTVILHYLSQQLPEIVFKGGTCLNKVYYPYFHMSEDLDFSLSTQDDIVNSNKKREKFARRMRDTIKHLATSMERTINPDKYHHQKAGGNPKLCRLEYTYLKYLLTYPSVFDQTQQTIKIELTYTTQRHLPAQKKTIQSVFIDKIFEDPIFPHQTIRCYDLDEMMAEKIRAGLTRRVPAIRDLFDVRYARRQGFDFERIRPLITAKTQEVGNAYTIHDHYNLLRQQITTNLEPVLSQDLDDFDFDEIYTFVRSFSSSSRLTI